MLEIFSKLKEVVSYRDTTHYGVLVTVPVKNRTDAGVAVATVATVSSNAAGIGADNDTDGNTYTDDGWS